MLGLYFIENWLAKSNIKIDKTFYTIVPQDSFFLYREQICSVLCSVRKKSKRKKTSVTVSVITSHLNDPTSKGGNMCTMKMAVSLVPWLSRGVYI